MLMMAVYPEYDWTCGHYSVGFKQSKLEHLMEHIQWTRVYGPVYLKVLCILITWARQVNLV